MSATPGGSGGGGGGGGFEVRVKQWHAVGVWTWDAGDDVCGICRNPFDGCPPECKYPGDDSPVVWGTCGHAFHLQCVTKWLASQAQTEQRCPICRRAWEFKMASAVERTR
ncbi:MAG: anaphase-promoting complex subunit 11 RING-H2 finger-domain-containing protein [Monoraphidium minutum]|nr:MAG: anaphase-promoting complex subunit 11 RING-H2 finger-domain-containing protein [Monoraphidium minutum]